MLCLARDPWADENGVSDEAGERSSESGDEPDNIYAQPRNQSNCNHRPSQPLLSDPALVHYRQRKQDALKQQDEVLDTMHASVKELWHVGNEINNQFDEHQQVLDGLEDDVEVRQRDASRSSWK